MLPPMSDRENTKAAPKAGGRGARFAGAMDEAAASHPVELLDSGDDAWRRGTLAG